MTTPENLDPRALTLDSVWLAEAADALREANITFAATHPGEGPGRQPVHTVYGGAQLFSFDTAPKIGRLAQKAMDVVTVMTIEEMNYDQVDAAAFELPEEVKSLLDKPANPKPEPKSEGEKRVEK